MSVDRYCRAGVDPWALSACDEHGAELAALGFQRGVSRLRAADAAIGVASQCVLCSGSLSIAEVRACRCHILGTPCPVHRPKPAGAVGEWSRVRCIKCGAELQLPADRIAFERSAALEGGVIAVDVTGWARRNDGDDDLCCPFHGAARYPLEHVSGSGVEADVPLDEDELDEDELEDDEALNDDERLH